MHIFIRCTRNGTYETADNIMYFSHGKAQSLNLDSVPT